MLELQQTAQGYDLYIDRHTKKEDKIILDMDNLEKNNLTKYQLDFVKAHI